MFLLFYAEQTEIQAEHGCTNAALSSDGGKLYQTDIPFDPNKSIFSSIKISVIMPLEIIYGPIPIEKITNTEDLTSKQLTY